MKNINVTWETYYQVDCNLVILTVGNNSKVITHKEFILFYEIVNELGDRYEAAKLLGYAD